ncbi:hypothetical protein RB195_012797 [Necator americanus]|uniref:Uncharacterized protein n=1 Tax=Necator americanus TaxID=51031 RepID=A0ABR1DU28_NECAM
MIVGSSLRPVRSDTTTQRRTISTVNEVILNLLRLGTQRAPSPSSGENNGFDMVEWRESRNILECSSLAENQISLNNDGEQSATNQLTTIVRLQRGPCARAWIGFCDGSASHGKDGSVRNFFLVLLPYVRLELLLLIINILIRARAGKSCASHRVEGQD